MIKMKIFGTFGLTISLHRAKLRRANVHFLSNSVKDGTTGTVIVLTTPDAQRTMLAYQVIINYCLIFYSEETLWFYILTKRWAHVVIRTSSIIPLWY
jgi:sugar/nucleoside kinase (ribokinase family)